MTEIVAELPSMADLAEDYAYRAGLHQRLREQAALLLTRINQATAAIT